MHAIPQQISNPIAVPPKIMPHTRTSIVIHKNTVNFGRHISLVEFIWYSTVQYSTHVHAFCHPWRQIHRPHTACPGIAEMRGAVYNLSIAVLQHT